MFGEHLCQSYRVTRNTLIIILCHPCLAPILCVSVGHTFINGCGIRKHFEKLIISLLQVSKLCIFRIQRQAINEIRQASTVHDIQLLQIHLKTDHVRLQNKLRY